MLDLDATDSPLRFSTAMTICYCYLPLYAFAGRHLVAAKLRPANIDAAAGAHQR